MNTNSLYTAVENPDWPDGRILVTIPHQMPAKAYGFTTLAEAVRQMEKAHVNRGYDATYYTQAEWNQQIDDIFGADWRDAEANGDQVKAKELHAKGEKLFLAGAGRIVERRKGETDDGELVSEEDHDAFAYLFDAATYDFHAAYFLDRERALGIVLTDAPYGTHHQALEWRALVRREAEQIGWIKPVPAVEETGADDLPSEPTKAKPRRTP